METLRVDRLVTPGKAPTASRTPRARPFAGIADLTRAASQLATYSEKARWYGTLLYASAGTDTRVFPYTHSALLQKTARAHPVPSPAVIFMIDVNEQPPLAFADDATVMSTVRATPIELPWSGISGRLSRVHLDCALGARDYGVVQLACTNEDFLLAAEAERWTPNMLVGVTDGCRFGGNPTCVNRLDGARDAIVPRLHALNGSFSWYITDHVAIPAAMPHHFPSGSRLDSDPQLPFSVRKLGLLSSQWGNYGRRTALGGATLFAIEERANTVRPRSQ